MIGTNEYYTFLTETYRIYLILILFRQSEWIENEYIRFNNRFLAHLNVETNLAHKVTS